MALKTPRKKEPFKPPASAETQFGRALRKVARMSGHIVEAHVDDYRLVGSEEMNEALSNYARFIKPWAERQSKRMLEQVSKSNRRSYNSKSNKIAQELKNADAHVLLRAQQLHRDQVELITTIPLKAGIRAQELAMQAAMNGKRADEVATALRAATEVSESDAMRIARTEVAKANAAITQARAQSIGSQAYIWRTTMDGAERPSHKAMNGKLIKYDSPPKLIDGTQGHAGEFINCLPGSSLLSGLPFVEKIYRRKYEGPLVCITFGNGKSIHATPNHPILTQNGFKPIDSIDLDHDLVACIDQKIDALKHDIDSFNISIEKFFDSLDMVPLFTRTVAHGGEFHGDSTHEKIDIININSSLIEERNASFKKHMFELGFSLSDMVFLNEFFARQSGRCQSSNASWSASDLIMRRFDLIFSEIKSHFTPLDLFCFISSSHDDSTLNQMPTNNGSATGKAFGDLIFAYTLLIHGFDAFHVQINHPSFCAPFFTFRCIDAFLSQFGCESAGRIPDQGTNLSNGVPLSSQFCRIVDKSSSHFSGHVYNLQTVCGSYISDAVVQGNCRCYQDVQFDDNE